MDLTPLNKDSAEIDLLSKMITNLGADTAEEVCLALPQGGASVVHHFSPGICVREVTVPSGTFAIGHYQKKQHLNVFLRGKVIVFKDDGEKEELTAPMMFIGQPGRKIGYVVEEMVWLNVYPTDSKNIEEVESEFLDKSENSLNSYDKRLTGSHEDNDDYLLLLEEIGYTEDQVQKESFTDSDMTDFPDGPCLVKTDKSAIHGVGLFLMADTKKDELICPMRIKDKRTPAGRYTNHSKHPNSEPIVIGDEVWIKAKRDINGCRGGGNGEEITIDYRNALKIRAELSEDKLCQQ